jgi:hypothetical protein
MTREGADLATVDDDQGAVAVILDLVNPALTERRELAVSGLSERALRTSLVDDMDR